MSGGAEFRIPQENGEVLSKRDGLWSSGPGTDF